MLALALLALLTYLVMLEKATTWWRVAFWALAPDLVLAPILLAARGGPWPRWGVPLYNATHTYLAMLPTLFLASVLQGHVVWPLLAWAAHIEMDRAVGLDLRGRA